MRGIHASEARLAEIEKSRPQPEGGASSGGACTDLRIGRSPLDTGAGGEVVKAAYDGRRGCTGVLLRASGGFRVR